MVRQSARPHSQEPQVRPLSSSSLDLSIMNINVDNKEIYLVKFLLLRLLSSYVYEKTDSLFHQMKH